MSGHTKEPWAWQEIDMEDKEWGACEIQADDNFVATMVLGAQNARRIVACVNACAGIETAQLENIVLIGDTLKERFFALTVEQDELIAQRDELISAAKLCKAHLAAWMKDHGDDIASIEAMNAANAAIAKAEAS